MQINRTSNNQQKTSFGMIGFPLRNDGKLIENATSVVFDKTMSQMEKRGLVKLGRDNKFNLFKYITLPMNCPEETHVLNSLKADSFLNAEQVEDVVGRDNIKRQELYLDFLDTTKTSGAMKRLKGMFPGVFE